MESAEPQRMHHLLSGRLPQGKDFVIKVPELIDELSAKLQISKDELDYSESSLEGIDEAIQRIGRFKCLEAEIFAPLVAYVGEVIKQSTEGRWELILAADGVTWEPWIIDSHGRFHPPFAIVFRELYEEDQEASIRGAVLGQIQSHLLG